MVGITGSYLGLPIVVVFFLFFFFAIIVRTTQNYFFDAHNFGILERAGLEN